MIAITLYLSHDLSGWPHEQSRVPSLRHRRDYDEFIHFLRVGGGGKLGSVLFKPHLLFFSFLFSEMVGL